MSTSHGRRRLKFDRAEVTEEADGQRRVRVTLTLGQLIFEADAAVAGGAGGPLGAAAVATLEAVQQAAANKFTCSLSDLDHANALGKDLMAGFVGFKVWGRDGQVFGGGPIRRREGGCEG